VSFVRDERETEWKSVLEPNEDFSLIIQSPQRMGQLTATKSQSIYPLEVREKPE